MQNETGNGLFQTIKGAALALILSLVLATAFAATLRFSGLKDGVIYPVNQAIKIVAISAGSLAFVRGEKGFLKGLGIGLLFTALSYLAFSAIGGDFSLSWLIAVEVLLAGLTGVISGALAVNLRGR